VWSVGPATERPSSPISQGTTGLIPTGNTFTRFITLSPRLTVTVEENVLVQLEQVRTHPSVATALARKELNIHGWVGRLETGQVFAYRPDREQYLPVEGTLAPSSRTGFPAI
jgi:hypothetical protein